MKTLNTTNYPILEENGFKIISVSPTTFPKFQQGIIKSYKGVFNASAWKEGVKCSKGCGYKTTFEESPVSCPDCGGGIEDFYSDQEITESVQEVLGKTYSQCLILLKDENVVGFTWGWQDCLESINQSKLGLGETELSEKLQNQLIEKDIKTKNGELYYQSETGVIPFYRTKGIGSALVGINEELLQQNKDKVFSIIQRTSRNSPMYNMRVNLGYTEIYSYDDSDERVLFAKNNI